ncbi:MAG: FxLYD domain-containing protein [Candidatus Omnitrophica bacterium]|nr:FxLYD domain-containing protein [Candidatus Omnitrophota bacterium]MBU1869458.1 FxLYD domain-containing protein [Candidatus Omnitrophota bacterium]
MSMLDFYNITFEKADNSKQMVIKGEVKNNSGRNYNAVAIRVVLFNKNIPVVSTVVVVNGVPNGSTKSFEKFVEEIEYEEVAKSINRQEAYIESAY